MKKIIFGLSLLFSCLAFVSFRSTAFRIGDDLTLDSLRKLYAGPSSLWPKANVDKNVKWEELGPLLPSPVDMKNDSVRKVAELGKILFFDPRLSGSNQISCSSCHNPDLNWADGKQVSIGHDHLANKRNAPSLENVWYFNKLFWDGRASSLEEQAKMPLEAHNEMNQDVKDLSRKLSKIKGYRPLFEGAFGTSKITNTQIFESIATFQRTIVTRKTAFDRFIEGEVRALSDQQVVGLHLFRTKARCINCHNGPYFTNNDFHNLGLTYYGRKYEDLGLYNITKDTADVGKFKTPGLRNVMKTGPWFHNGLFGDMDGILNMYNMGMPMQVVRPGQENDPLLPKNDKLLRGIRLSNNEKAALMSFLESLSSGTYVVRDVELPK